MAYTIELEGMEYTFEESDNRKFEKLVKDFAKSSSSIVKEHKLRSAHGDKARAEKVKRYYRWLTLKEDQKRADEIAERTKRPPNFKPKNPRFSNRTQGNGRQAR